MKNIDIKIKHLEMIQAIINRLAGNCFLIKGWTITISLAGFSLFANNKSQVMFLGLAAFAIIIFWVLDAYYLRQERLFRELYKSVATKNELDGNFFIIDISPFQKIVPCILCVMFSFPTSLIYLALLGLTSFLYLGFK